MTLGHRLKLLLRNLLHPDRADQDIDDELRAHLAMLIDEKVAAGIPEAEAPRAAIIELGGINQVKERVMEVRMGAMLEQLWRDARFGARLLRFNPGFACVAILSLALGVGANTAIFQLLDALRLRTLPVDNPQEIALVRIKDMTGARGNFDSPHPPVTNPVWEQIRDRQQAFSGIFAWGTNTFNMSSGGEARYADGLWVSGDFFNVLGVRPVLGRLLTSADDYRGCPATAVISYNFWQSEYGGDPSVLGRTLTLKACPFLIVGVTPASFFGLEVGRSFDVAVPICSEALMWRTESRLDQGVQWWLTVMGRLKPGWSLEQASAQLRSISPEIFAATLAPNYPRENAKDYLGFQLEASPAANGVSELREVYEDPLWLLLALAGLVLLIACANLASLMLARASAREREIAVRLALGASRSRLVRQLLAESLILAVLGAVAGALLAQAMSRLLVSLLSSEGDNVPLNLDLDWRVLTFTAGIAILTLVVFGLTPALRGTRIAIGAAMKAGGRALTASRERLSLRRVLVVSQVALSLVLLSGALLLSRSLANLLTLDAGFQQNGILVTNVALTRLQLSPEQRLELEKDLLNRIRAITGVEAVADARVVPLSGAAWVNRAWPDGSDSSQARASFFNRVSPDFFHTLEIPLLSGRDFSDIDSQTSPRVAIVNETFARQFTGGVNPVGQRFWKEATPSEPETIYEIVGLVKDAKYRDLRERPAAVAFLPASQDPGPGLFDRIIVRSGNESLAALIGAVKSAIGEANPEILIDFQPLRTRIESSLLRERLMATLSGFFGLLALLLAGVGLYGVLAYGVARRTNEIGIRMALGARPLNVLWLILREAVLMAFIGIVVGLPAVLSTTGLISSLLFGLTPSDPTSLSAAALILLLVAAVAGYLPARRASRVDPVIALRCE
jgi:putative ABC transport system permease protein